MINKPFSNEYVIRETLKHMQNSVHISTQKTLSRMKEFQDEPEKLSEVLDALSNLNRLNKLIEDIRDNNVEVLGEQN